MNWKTVLLVFVILAAVGSPLMVQASYDLDRAESLSMPDLDRGTTFSSPSEDKMAYDGDRASHYPPYHQPDGGGGQ